MSHTVGRMGEAVTLPTGTVTFLMTDIEGSTRGWSQSPAALTAAVPRHYQILDDAIVAHGGVRPVEQGEGDSAVAAFSRASDAVHAALLAQRSLTAEPWLDGACGSSPTPTSKATSRRRGPSTPTATTCRRS